MTKDNSKETLTFYWDFGDDETETLLLTSDDVAIDFYDCALDLFIVPDSRDDAVIHLTNNNGLEIKENGEIKITCTREKVKSASWRSASWDLKMTNAKNWRDTLCGGKIIRNQYYPHKRIEGLEGEQS